MKAKRRSRRSQIHKYLWVAGTMGTVGTAATAMGEGLPYNFASNWDVSASAFSPVSDSFSSQTSRYSELETGNSSETTRSFSSAFLDAGLNAMWSSLTLRPYFPMFRPVLGGDSEDQMQADNTGWSGTGHDGLVWNITKRQHLAFNYSSPLEGDDNNHFSTSGFNPGMVFPTIFGAGYGFKLTDALSLETDVELLQFARYYSHAFSTGSGTGFFSGSANPTSVLGNWHNALVSSLGADWKFAGHWILRAGYQFFENPVHNSGFSPSIPDVNQHVFSLGIGWKGKRSSLELAYALDFYYDRHIANDSQPGFDGSYGFNGHLLSMAYKFSF